MPDNDPAVRKEIYERLREIDRHLQKLIMESTRIKDMVEDHNEIIRGKGTTPGMIIRVHDVEQMLFTSKWMLRTAATAVLGALVIAVLSMFGFRQQ